MTVWEYLYFPPQTAMSEGDLNKLGEGCWELVVVVNSGTTSGNSYYFKRPKED